MALTSYMRPVDHTRLTTAADWFAVATAVSLPWSTSATGILVVLWLIALIPTLDGADLRRQLTTAAGGLPVALVAFGVLGMAWAGVSWAERWGGVSSFFRLLVIPLLFVQFRRSDGGQRVFVGFLLSCVALLVASFVVKIWPNIPRASVDEGVPVKGYILQSVEFTICAAVLFDLAMTKAKLQQWKISAGLAVLALAFLGNILFVVTGRTALVIIPALALLYGYRHSGWKGFLAACALMLAVAAAGWTASPYLRERVSGIWSETERYEKSSEANSSGLRLDFWRKSIGFIESAPLLGHGTGSITDEFKRAKDLRTPVGATIAANPHNQTFAVGIQLGLLGIAVLWAMWLSHFMLFRAGGLWAWIGLVVVTQNVVGSLFNSFLFDFTEGWLYVLGVGVAGGMVLKARAARTPGAAP
jgi:O-antigen ligase